jgi:hypothetical protein
MRQQRFSAASRMNAWIGPFALWWARAISSQGREQCAPTQISAFHKQRKNLGQFFMVFNQSGDGIDEARTCARLYPQHLEWFADATQQIDVVAALVCHGSVLHSSSVIQSKGSTAEPVSTPSIIEQVKPVHVGASGTDWLPHASSSQLGMLLPPRKVFRVTLKVGTDRILYTGVVSEIRLASDKRWALCRKICGIAAYELARVRGVIPGT